MLISLLRGEDPAAAIVTVLMLIPVILFSLSLHEFSHGYIAYKCGDKTAKMFGRLTLNPIKHLDPIGALMMLFIGFGWAKPVPVNMRNFRKPKRDMVLVSLAGPASNLVLALVAALIHAAYLKFVPFPDSETGLRLFLIVSNVLMLFRICNIGLALFNLLPVPPLDGSKILAGLLPNELAYRYLKNEKYFRYVFLILIISTWIPVKVGSFNDLGDILFYPLELVREAVSDGMCALAQLIFSLDSGIKALLFNIFSV